MVSTRSRAIGTAAAVLVATIGLSACGTGQTWVDEGLAPSGNGAYVTVGPIKAQNLTLVAGPAGSKSLSLIGNLINNGREADALVSATLGTTPGVISGGAIELLPSATQAHSIGYNSDNSVSFLAADSKVATYQTVTLSFKNAGDVTTSLLVVEPTGMYEGITPAASVANKPA
jgi:hypothetical protein